VTKKKKLVYLNKKNQELKKIATKCKKLLANNQLPNRKNQGTCAYWIGK